MFDREIQLGRAGGLLVMLLLAGCGAEGIHDDAQQMIKVGNYEQALRAYQDGVDHYPESAVLRSGLVSARESIFARLMTSATAARTSGNDKLADQIVARALALNPNDERAKALALDIARDRRQKQAVANVRDLLDKGMRERASIMLEAALKDNPRNAELLAFQRQLELEAKQAELSGAQLSETRPVSLDFRDANLRSVLDLLTRNSGVNFVLDKDVRSDLRATVFLRQTRLDDALTLITSTNQLAYKVVDPTTVLIYPKTPDKMKEYQDLMIRAFYLSSAEAKQTALLLKTMLKIRDPFVDDKLNMIMIRETPETIRLAERVIALHDIAEPEVTIEMEVLEVTRTSLTELGIKYPDAFTLTAIAPTGSDGFTLGNLKSLNRDSIGITIPDVTLNLHRDVGDVNLLANPKIRARNHEKANIMIGDKLPVVTTTGSAANSGYISESVQYVDVGLKLAVEPTIYLDDEVAIKVGLEVSSLVSEIKTTGGSLVYQIGTRNTNTALRLHDGETQLLAGLINNEERMSANRIPGAGDLPIVGRLFSSQRDSGNRTEIVLSITPHIVHNIRRPDLNQTEFWSGTESDLRSRPLMLPQVVKTADQKGLAAGLAAVAATAAPSATVATSMTDATVAVSADAGAHPPPEFSLALQAPTEVKAGEVFTVQINMKTAAPVRGIPVQLQFSKNLLQVVDVEEGPFFKQDGAITSATKGLEQVQGRASMAILRNVADGAKGEGTVMSFRFKALVAGPAEVGLVSAQAIANGPMIQPSLPAATKITVK